MKIEVRMHNTHTYFYGAMEWSQVSSRLNKSSLITQLSCSSGGYQCHCLTVFFLGLYRIWKFLVYENAWKKIITGQLAGIKIAAIKRVHNTACVCEGGYVGLWAWLCSSASCGWSKVQNRVASDPRFDVLLPRPLRHVFYWIFKLDSKVAKLMTLFSYFY